MLKTTYIINAKNIDSLDYFIGIFSSLANEKFTNRMISDSDIIVKYKTINLDQFNDFIKELTIDLKNEPKFRNETQFLESGEREIYSPLLGGNTISFKDIKICKNI